MRVLKAALVALILSVGVAAPVGAGRNYGVLVQPRLAPITPTTIRGWCE